MWEVKNSSHWTGQKHQQEVCGKLKQWTVQTMCGELKQWMLYYYYLLFTLLIMLIVLLCKHKSSKHEPRFIKFYTHKCRLPCIPCIEQLMWSYLQQLLHTHFRKSVSNKEMLCFDYGKRLNCSSFLTFLFKIVPWSSGSIAQLDIYFTSITSL